MACCGLCFVARVCITVKAMGRAVSCALWVSSLLLPFMCALLHVVVVLLCVVVGAFSVFGVFYVFSPTLLSLYFITLFITVYQYFSLLLLLLI